MSRERTAPAAEGMPWQRLDSVVVVALTVVIGALYLATASYGPAQTNDTRAASVAAWSVGTRGSAVLPEAWPASSNYWGAQGRGGGVLVNRFPGVAYWAAPVYALTTKGSAPAHPFLVGVAPAAVSAGLTSAAVVALLFILLRAELRRRTALFATVAMATATSLWSVAADAMWPHAPAMLGLAVMLLGWRRGNVLLAGTGAAVAVLVRPHLIVAIVVLALFASLWEQRRSAMALAGGGLVGIAVLTCYSAWAFGTWMPVAGYDAVTHLDGLIAHSPWQTVRDLALALTSPSHGLLVTSPFLLAAAWALLRVWRDVPVWALASTVAGLLYLLVQVRAVGYRGGDDFFAYRIWLETLLLAAPALAFAGAEAARRSRRFVPVLGLLTVVSIGIHAYGAVAGGISPGRVQEWDTIHANVQGAYGDVQLGQVDLSP